MKNSTIFILIILSTISFTFAQNNLIIGAGGGVVYGVNESPQRAINGVGRINAVLTNAFGSFLSPELGLNIFSLSGKKASEFESKLINADLGLRWYVFQAGDWKPYIYAGIGIGSYKSNYNNWHSEFATKNGEEVDTKDGTHYAAFGETVKWSKSYEANRMKLINDAGGRAAYYNSADKTALNGESKGTALLFPISIGLTYQASRDININLALSNYFSNSDDINPYQDDVNDAFWAGLISVNYNIGNIFGSNDDEDGKAFDGFQLGTTIILSEVSFESGSSKINKSSYAMLRRAFTTMNDNPSLEVKIEGHTDDTGDQQINTQISNERAESVKKWLVDKGISPGRISTNGAGSRKPLVPNDSPANQAKNRRVEFTRTK